MNISRVNRLGLTGGCLSFFRYSDSDRIHLCFPLRELRRVRQPGHFLPMKMTRKLTVEASAARTWTVVGEEFADIGHWASAVNHSYLDSSQVGVGVSRTCQLPRGDLLAAPETVERLTVYLPEKMTLAYQVTSGLASFIRRAQNTWTIQPLDKERTTIRTQVEMKLAWWSLPLQPLLLIGLHFTAKSFLEELAYYVERGEPHPSKRRSVLSTSQ